MEVGIHELDVFENTIPYILGRETWEQRIQVKSGDWSNPRVNQAIEAFLKDKSQFVLGDLTGIIDSLLERMVRGSNSAIAIGKDQSSLEKWLSFFDSQGIPVLIKVVSYVDNLPMPEIVSKDVVFVGNLKRKIIATDEIRKIVSILLKYYNCAG